MMPNIKVSELPEKYPSLFHEEDKTTLISSIQCDDGWYELLDVLCASIKQEIEHTKTTCRVEQVKEKFGGLRFYCTGNEAVQGMVRLAEAYSYYLCEKCGNKGKLCDIRGWRQTLCDDCYEKKIVIVDNKARGG